MILGGNEEDTEFLSVGAVASDVIDGAVSIYM